MKKLLILLTLFVSPMLAYATDCEFINSSG